MQNNQYKIITILAVSVVLLAIMLLGHKSLPFLVPLVFAHCDTLGGPVIQSAKKALETGNINLVLIWVQKDDEAQIREAFQETLKVRKLSPEAKELAGRSFFETLVRIHRAGEGAAFTGLKTDENLSPAVMAADEALESGSVDSLVNEVSHAVAGGIPERFNQVLEKKKHRDESVEAGREYVAAYVEYVHYVERLHLDASVQLAHHQESEAEDTEITHRH